MLNFAILSAGNIAGRMARTLDSLRDEVQPYAIAARDSARAQALAGRYGFAKSFAGYEALLADPAVDVVYIGSIHPLHAQHIRAALLAGKHVLCEKPLTLNAAQAQSLFALARERGLLNLKTADVLDNNVHVDAYAAFCAGSAQNAGGRAAGRAAPGDGCAG